MIKKSKRITSFLIVALIFLLCSCSNTNSIPKEYKINDYTLNGEYQMHVGSKKRIYSFKNIHYDSTNVQVTLYKVEGDNLDSLEFNTENTSNYFLTVSCISKIDDNKKPVLKKVYYQSEDKTLYYVDANLSFADEKAYKDTQPFIQEFSFYDSGFTYYKTFPNLLLIKLNNSLIGNKKSLGRTLNNITCKYSSYVGFVEVTAENKDLWLKYKLDVEEYKKNFEELSNPINFDEKEYYVLFVYDLDYDTTNIEHFDIIFNIDINGENYLINQGMPNA